MQIKSKKSLIAIGMILLCITFTLAIKANAAAETLSVINISTSDKPGYTIYWPKDKGNAKLERAEGNGAFVTIAETSENFYADFSVKKGAHYSYKVSYSGNVLTGISLDLQAGKPALSSIKVDSGTATKSEASVVVNFKTDRLARSQVLYGTSLSYESQTVLGEDLNQSHTVLIEKLKPDTTYHLKIRATDKLGKDNTESEDQTFITPTSPPDQSLLEIIIKALSQAFSGFESWLRS